MLFGSYPEIKLKGNKEKYWKYLRSKLFMFRVASYPNPFWIYKSGSDNYLCRGGNPILYLSYDLFIEDLLTSRFCMCSYDEQEI